MRIEIVTTHETSWPGCTILLGMHMNCAFSRLASDSESNREGEKTTTRTYFFRAENRSALLIQVCRSGRRFRLDLDLPAHLGRFLPGLGLHDEMPDASAFTLSWLIFSRLGQYHQTSVQKIRFPLVRRRISRVHLSCGDLSPEST